MNDDLKQLIISFGYNVEAMQKDNVPMSDYKELLKAKGYDTDAMDKDGMFGTTHLPEEQQLGPNFLSESMTQQLPSTPDIVKAEDSKTTMTMLEVEASTRQGQENIDKALQTIAGARQSVTLPLAKTFEDAFRSIGIDLGDTSSQNLAKVNKYINDYNEKHPDQIIHPATIGNILSQLAVPMAKSYKAIGAIEGTLGALHGIGQNEDYDNVIEDAAIGAVFGVTVMAVFERLVRSLGPLSYEAKLLINSHPELDEASMLKVLEGVPQSDQAYVLSNIVEDDFVDFTTKAVGSNNSDKLLLKEQLAGRTKIIKKTIGDVEKQVDEAKRAYSDMINEVAADAHNVFTFKAMLPKLDGLIKRYDKTPSKALSIVNNMKADLKAGAGTMNVRTALQFRQDLNYLLNRAKRFEEKELIKSIKKGVDSFIAKNVDGHTLANVDKAISNYSRAMNNSDFIDVMSKFTKQKSTDWVGLQKKLKTEKLSSPEVNNAIEIVKEFSEKFKNDKQLRGSVKTKGQKDNPGGMLSVFSYAINTSRDALALFGKRYEELKIQKAILKSIRTAKNPVEVFKFMKVNKVPPKLVKNLQKSLLIEYHPDKPTSVTNPEGEVRTLYTTPQGTTSKTPLGGMAHESFTGQHDLIGLPAPRDPLEAPTTKIESGETKFVSEEGRVSTDIDIANPPEFVSTTKSIDVNSVLTTVRDSQRAIGVNTRLSLADTKTAKYGHNLSDNQLKIDRDRSVRAINLIVEKSQRGEALSRRDRETLLKGLARTRQIDRELDIRGYEGNYQMDVPREADSSMDRPGNYRPRAGQQVERTPVAPQTRGPAGPDAGGPAGPDARGPAGPDAGAIKISDVVNQGEFYSTVIGSTVAISATKGGPSMFFSLRGNTFRANSTSFRRGSGVGGRVYKAFWDSIRGTKFKAQPTGGMYTVNQFRMSVNMLEYAAKHGDSPQVLIYAGANNAQKGASDALNNQPLTVENANQLAQGLLKWTNTNVLGKFDKKLHERTTDAQITEMVEQARREPSLQSNGTVKFPFGVKTLKLLRRVAQTGSLTTLSGVFGMLMMQEDFVDYLDTLDKGDETN